MRFPLREHFTFERFCVGPNREAVAHLREGPDGFRCVWLWGRPGTGKSHLLQAACHAGDGAYVPARKLRDVDGYQGFAHVLIDDVDCWFGDRDAEEALFRLYNAQMAHGHALTLAATLPPALVDFALGDLASRMRSATCFELAALSDEDAVPVLKRAAQDRGFDLSDDVVGYLLRRVGRGLPEMLEHLETIDRASLSARRRITVASSRTPSPWARDMRPKATRSRASDVPRTMGRAGG